MGRFIEEERVVALFDREITIGMSIVGLVHAVQDDHTWLRVSLEVIEQLRDDSFRPSSLEALRVQDK